MRPFVTVGVCVKDSAHTLAEAIQSIHAQDYPHDRMEIVFVDDGSKDATPSVIRKYAAEKTISSRVFSTPWRGLGASRNLVVEEAKGRYIAWVDADMLLPKDHVSKQVEFMEKNPKVGIAKARYGDAEDSNLLGFLENAAYVAVDSLYGGRPTTRTLGTGGAVYRIEAIRQAGGFDVRHSGVGEDMEAESKVKAAGWDLYMGSPAVFYERRRKSLKAIWREGFWHGYGGYRLFKKNSSAFALYKMTPPAGFIAGTWYSTVAYRLTGRKAVFLLPLHYAFKRLAWCLGFTKGQIEK